MDIRDSTLEVITLRAKNYREHDKLLTMVSTFGPLTAIARGAGKSNGSLRSISLPWTRSHVTLSPEKYGLRYLREGLLQESYLPPDGSLERFAYAAYVGEILCAAWPQGKEEPELYYLLQAVLTMLKLDNDPKRTTRFFELQLLRILGLLPELDCCALCGKKPPQPEFALFPAEGQLLCRSCADNLHLPRISSGALLTMQRLLAVPLDRVRTIRLSPAIHQEMERALRHYLSYHIDHVTRAAKILRSLTEE